MRLFLNVFAWVFSGTKALPATISGLLLAPVVALVEKYLFSDWDFLAFLCVLIMVDTVLGVQRNWSRHQLSSRRFSRLFTKAGVYLLLLVLTHVLCTFPVQGKPNGIFTWFDKFMYSCMMAREALSILEHVAFVAPGLVPKGLLKRLALISDEGIDAALTAQPIAQHSDVPLNLTPVAPLPVAPLPTAVAPSLILQPDESPLPPNRYDPD